MATIEFICSSEATRTALSCSVRPESSSTHCWTTDGLLMLLEVSSSGGGLAVRAVVITSSLGGGRLVLLEEDLSSGKARLDR